MLLTQAEFGRRVGLSEARVSQLERSPSIGVFTRVLHRIADIASKPVDRIAVELAPDDLPLDENLEPYGEIAVPEIPTFELPIAAGPWMELPEVDSISDMRVIKDGRFRIHIRGDSMEKKYLDGSLIEFRCLKPEIPGVQRASRLETGKDYYVQKAECATFKTLESFDEMQLVFRAINRKKYRDPIIVLRSDISRMAQAEFILTRT
jgi:hypothetical protein